MGRSAARLAFAVTSASVLLITLVTPAHALTIQEYPSPHGDDIALGPDGNMWSALQDVFAVARITDTGAITDLPVTQRDTEYLVGTTSGPDGKIWFTEDYGGGSGEYARIGRMTTSGTVTEFTLPTITSGAGRIAPGPDGALWFAGDPSAIGRITTSGKITEFPIPGGDTADITAGPDGNMWFTEQDDNKIGRITTSASGTAGTVTEFSIPTADSLPQYITAGPDGNLWFTEFAGQQIGRITPNGTITQFPISSGDSPFDIASGPDGDLWFTENCAFFLCDTPEGAVARMSVTGSVVDETPIPSDSEAMAIAPGADGTMWITEGGAFGKIGPSDVHIRYVAYIPNFFIRKVAPLSELGDSVSWQMLNPGTHGVLDGTGMGLYGYAPTGAIAAIGIGQSFSYTFDWAGTYPYSDPFHRSAKGKVKVPLSVVPVVGAVGQAGVTWASASAPIGSVFDVQIKVPGSSTFVDWMPGTSQLQATFGQSDPAWAGPGKYAFRARLRQVVTGAASGYSAAASIKIRKT